MQFRTMLTPICGASGADVFLVCYVDGCCNAKTIISTSATLHKVIAFPFVPDCLAQVWRWPAERDADGSASIHGARFNFLTFNESSRAA